MPTMVKVVCAHCKKEFEKELKKYNYSIKNGHKHYCSKECVDDAKRNGKYYPCGYCGELVYRTKSELERSKSGKVFCNRSCSTSYHNMSIKSGEGHPNYKNGQGSYRNKAFKFYDNVCATCNWHEDPRILEVHHIDFNRTNNDIENLIILCPICHRKITNKHYHLDVKNKKLIKND